ncbi:MAG TPA: response regulator [Pirellulales bacterium]|nr:response regulator [Pirellulales bacterium]
MTQVSTFNGPAGSVAPAPSSTGPLRAAVRAARQRKQARAMPAAKPAEQRGVGPEVLVVDDDRSVCEVVARLLSENGYTVDAAFDGHAALDMLARRPYVLAIFDYRMHDIDGVEVYRRAKEFRPDLAGVLLTAWTTIDVVFPAMSVGFARVLAKPVDARILLPVVARLMAMREKSWLRIQHTSKK